MKKIGHRGACGYAPENTLVSFRKALEFGVDGIEFDIRLSSDGEPMVIHDDTINRTTNGQGFISDYTYQQLQQFDAGQGKVPGEKIPHLNDVFALIDRRCDLLIELKMDAVEAVEAVIRAWVEKGWDYGSIWVLAFDHRLLAKMKRINPRVQTATNMECIPVSLAGIATDAGANGIGPCVGCLDQLLVDDAHKRGMKVFTWTANRPADIARAKALGVDGIISDFPERL